MLHSESLVQVTTSYKYNKGAHWEERGKLQIYKNEDGNWK